MTRHRTFIVVAALLALALISACSSAREREPVPAAAVGDQGATTTTVLGATPSTSAPSVTTTTAAPAPDGRRAPRAAADPVALAQQIVSTERALRDPATPASARPDLGHLNQVAYRRLSYEPALDAAVLAAVPADLQAVVRAQVAARREFLAMRTTIPVTVPAWEVARPEPAEQLLAYYREAERATGIRWQYLAAINLVETGLGRVHGLSVSGARGPMQFLPTTWAEKGIGQGDIDDPHDAIQAAARYLVRRGGPSDMAKALRGYNNHANYVRAVTLYADLLMQDEQAFQVFYNWEIYYLSAAGDLWLATGYRETAPLDVSVYLAKSPWSAPPPGVPIPPLSN